MANDLKTQINAHRTEAGVHPTDDVVNVITAANATDLATSLILLIDIKTQFNAHIIESGVHVVNDPRDTINAVDPTDLNTAKSLANEIRLKYERHRVSTEFHSISDIINITVVPSTQPVNSSWVLATEGLGTPDISLQMAGPNNVLRYGTTGAIAPISTAYKRSTGLTDDNSINFEVTVNLRINNFNNVSNTVDTSIYAGFLSKIGPGIGAAIGFDALEGIPYVKIQDINANESVFRVPFNWNDNSFHTYKLIRSAETNSIGLVIVS